MPIAYSYKRFSSDAQEGNDSIRRQTAAAQKFIEDHPEYELTLDTTLSLTDAGVSAFTGKNLKEGALGKFVNAVRDGLIPEGSWLLLESLDRFSRQAVHIAAGDLLNLINRGIVVCTLHNETIYREEDFTESSAGLVNLLAAIIAMEGHHKEQVTKGKRVAEAWSAKYRKIPEGHIVTRSIPFWLEVNKNRTGFEIVEDRASIVREVFTRRANGEGKTKIANDLTARGVPTSKGLASIWHPSAIQKLLSSDSVVGALVNNKGERFENYYPTVIEPELFQAVNALRKQSGATGLTSKAHPLTGLVKHDCGTTMRRINKGASAGGKPKFQCPKCRVGLPFHEALDLVKQALFSSQYVASTSSKGGDILALQGAIDALEDEVEDAYSHWRSVKTVEARQRWDRLVTEIDSMREELRDFQRRDTEVLLAIEEKALSRAAEHGSLINGLRSVAVKAIFNADCSELELHTISGRVVREYRLSTI